jgi:hypothetical protein
MVSEIQAVIFNKQVWNQNKAQQELKKMGLKPIKPVHETSNYLRYRLHDPSQYTHFVTKPNQNQFKLVIGFK